MLRENARNFPVSLVIPIRNEESSIESLIASIERQAFQPDEIIAVDGGSTDQTVEAIERLVAVNSKIKLVRTEEATPGKGRNIGIKNARNEWIALTDAGIRLDEDWLEELVRTADESGADIVYGNYSPVLDGIFEKCATIAYVPPKAVNGIRGKSIASCLLKKRVWDKVGGFPDLRAAEDLIFMDAVEAAGFKAVNAPDAMIRWHLRPNFWSTFKKFLLYSKHNVWAGRQWDWHYGIARQYAFLLPFILLVIFHSPWWLIAVVLWLAARTAKRILAHRFEFGVAAGFNPLVFFIVALLILTIDAATFIGWGQALLTEQKNG